MIQKNNIFGVDLTKTVTPPMVLDAIVKCFSEAHSEVLEGSKEYHKFESEEEFEKFKTINVEMLIRSKFREVGTDVENPTKEDLMKLISKLAEFASAFRSREVIEKHSKEIMKLIDKL